MYISSLSFGFPFLKDELLPADISSHAGAQQTVAFSLSGVFKRTADEGQQHSQLFIAGLVCHGLTKTEQLLDRGIALFIRWMFVTYFGMLH